MSRKIRKQIQKNPVVVHNKKTNFKQTEINPFTDTYEFKSDNIEPFYTRTESSGARTQNPLFSRAIENEAFSRKLDVDTRKKIKELTADEPIPYKGPLVDFSYKYLGRRKLQEHIGEPIEKGYDKLVKGVKKIGKKIKKKIKGNKEGNFVEVPVKLARTKKTRLY